MELLKNIKFYDLHLKINQEINPERLCWPGIFCIKNNVTNRVFFVDDECLLKGIHQFFENLSNGSIKNDQLLKDYILYGKEGFTFFALEADFELENAIKRKKKLEKYLKINSNQLY